MELVNIEKLVIKYENAETSIREEEILREYFTSDHVAPHLEEYQLMFSYFKNNQDITYNKSIQLTPKRSRKQHWKWMSIAASIALIFSMYLGKTQYDDYLAKKEARETYAQVEQALKMLSTNLKKGNEAFENLYAYEDTVNKILKTK